MSDSKLINFLIFGTTTPSPPLRVAAAEVVVDNTLNAFAQIVAADKIRHLREDYRRQTAGALLVQQAKRDHQLLQQMRAMQQPIKHYFQQFVLPDIWLAPLTARPDYIKRHTQRAATRRTVIEREYLTDLIVRSEVTEVLYHWSQCHLMRLTIREVHENILDHSSPYDDLDLGILFA